MRGMISSRTQGACIPHISHFHHGGIRSALGSEVRVPHLLSDHWRFGKAPPCNPPTKLPMQDLFILQSFPCSTSDDLSCFPPCSYILHSHIISFHFQFFFTSSFLCLSFTLILMTVILLWVNLGLWKALSTRLCGTHQTPYDIYGSQSLLSVKLLHVVQCFISYEWRAWVKVPSWCLSEQKKLVVCEFRSPVCFAHPSSGWEKNWAWFRDKRRSGTLKKDVNWNFMITFLKKSHREVGPVFLE